DDLQVGDHPAAMLEVPVVGETGELPLARDVGIERKGATSHRAVLALAEGGAFAFDGHAGVMQAVDDLAAGSVVRLETVPEVTARSQQLVFGLQNERHGILGRAADRLAAIQGRAFAPAVETRDRRLEALVDAREVFGFGGHGPVQSPASEVSQIDVSCDIRQALLALRMAKIILRPLFCALARAGVARGGDMPKFWVIG